MCILVTGGAGYIGSHFVRLLKRKDIDVVVFDNLSRGHREAVADGVPFENVDLLNPEALKEKLKKYPVEAVVHFAAFAYVGESVSNPRMYYVNNVQGSINLLNAVVEAGIRKVVFSSTCSLYGNPLKVPISEKETVKPINPYAKTKSMIENVLADYEAAYGLKYAALRYFNAAGCSFDGEIGESHSPETHLIPLVINTALEKLDSISVFGDDYPTPDGTCVRDYIHVDDLGKAHLKALEYLNCGNKSDVFNLGTGRGNSVKEIIATVERISGKKVEHKISERREGDPAVLVADNRKAAEVLGWTPSYSLNDIIKSAWNWHSAPKY
jgi:UDP-glucose 4-epimerase